MNKPFDTAHGRAAAMGYPYLTGRYAIYRDGKTILHEFAEAVEDNGYSPNRMFVGFILPNRRWAYMPEHAVLTECLPIIDPDKIANKQD